MPEERMNGEVSQRRSFFCPREDELDRFRTDIRCRLENGAHDHVLQPWHDHSVGEKPKPKASVLMRSYEGELLVRALKKCVERSASVPKSQPSLRPTERYIALDLGLENPASPFNVP